MIKRLLQAGFTTPLATFVAIATVAIVGVLWWPLARGLLGIGVGTTIAVLIAVSFQYGLRWASSPFAAGISAMIGCFLLIASGETARPGSVEWALQGGIYGAVIGIPVALLLSPFGAIESSKHEAVTKVTEKLTEVSD